MVNSVLPLYLTFQLGFSKLELGVFNGAFQAIAVAATLVGAWIADRRRRYKEVAGCGYAASAASRIGLVAARSSWIPATVLISLDRVAKGVRTAPRDALISISSVPRHLGEAFGVHRTFDTAGALAGPIVAFFVLSAAPLGYEAVFSTSFWIAVVGLAVFVLFVRNPARPAPRDAPTGARQVRMTMLARLPRFRALVIAATLLSLFTIADAFVYLTFQQRTSMSLQYFPLLFAGTAAVYTVFALPLGRLADRVGFVPVFLAGQLFIVAVDVVLLQPDPGGVALVIMLGALGLSYAGTDGVLAALAANLLPLEVRTSGLAVLGSAVGLAKFAASVAFGALWAWKGATFAVGAFLAGFVVAFLAAAVLLRTARPLGHPANVTERA
jgi:MFS family permease